ncbi:hypothetical protein [Acanthopleuribacter pedis]|uniref:DUF3375 domain-containing protein n=1 Tax=Acanthopleuribacter pedis TaxID=442870 RepID=A0A8J7QIB2_9BACT|nr:hypothetical protein [Acanthopleuribacter pedis]MBO1322920.1 hypothetical protein [Acanthopleuribacter pedis]
MSGNALPPNPSFLPEVDASALFADAVLEAFDRGVAAHLTHNRRASLANLLAAPRALYYLNILYRLRLFRNDHELEPLYEDLFEAVEVAQTHCGGAAYSRDQFREDMTALRDWTLVDERIEKQRIRGYRDNRKTKYRYSLDDETLQFLVWLEDRLQDDLEGRGADTRNQLEDAGGALRELLRLLRKFQGAAADEENARRILYQLSRLDAICTDINSGLAELNARLIAFATLSYNLEEVKGILSELETYVDRFLQQVRRLRHDILTQLEQLEPLDKRLARAYDLMESQRRKTPHLMRHHNLHPDQARKRLTRFFREGGSLDQSCVRLGQSSLAALRKMYTHLREMERKSHRLEDLADRLTELSRFDPDQVPTEFFVALISSAHGRFNMSPYEGGEKMNPPAVPVLQKVRKQPPKRYMRAAKTNDEPVVTMEEARLQALRVWLEAKVLAANGSGRVGSGSFDEFDDFPRIVALAKAGFLGNGRKLASLDLTATALPEETRVAIAAQSLVFNDMEIKPT